MALYRLEFLISSDVDVTNGTATVTLNDGQDVSSVVPGTAIFINNQVVEAISGQNISPTQSTITLRYNWPFTTVTAGRLVAFNTFEGLNTAITRLNDVISSVPDFTGATGQGLLYNDGTDTYSIKPSTIFGESLLNAADASEASTLLQSPDYPSLSGQAGILKKDALDVYSLVTSTAFGESLLSQADAASTRSTIGVNSATDLAEGLIRKQTQAEALAGIDSSGSMSALRVHQAFNQYGIGVENTRILSAPSETGIYALARGSDGATVPSWLPTGNYSKVIPMVDGSLSVTLLYDINRRTWFFTENLSGDDGNGIYSNPSEIYSSYNLKWLQNTSGGDVANNNNVSGSNLTPAQTGSWKNKTGLTVNDSGYGWFDRVK